MNKQNQSAQPRERVERNSKENLLRHAPLPVSRRQAWLLAESVRHEILVQKLSPGDRLSGERQLMENYGLARATVREGLAILESQGLITITPGRYGGVVVSAVPAKPVFDSLDAYFHFEKVTWNDLYRARLHIEPEVAGLAFDAIDDEGISALQETIERCHLGQQQNISRRDHKIAEIEFHEIIAAYCGNPILRFSSLHLAHAMRQTIETLLAVDTAQAAECIIEDHVRIVQAFQVGKKEEVVELMRSHVVDSDMEIHRLMESRHHETGESSSIPNNTGSHARK